MESAVAEAERRSTEAEQTTTMAEAARHKVKPLLLGSGILTHFVKFDGFDRQFQFKF